MDKLITLALFLVLVPVSTAYCQIVEEEPVYEDNTGALGTGSNEANIQSGEESATLGTIEGQITIYRTTEGVEVYANANKVESIPENSDGWIGHVVDNGSIINFQPAGRPNLDCPAQAITNWYGPCRVPDPEG